METSAQRAESAWARLDRALSAPQDARGLAVFRVLFGAVMVAATLRFLLKGWVDELYVAPEYHFTYWGFEWVKPWPRVGLYVHFALLGITALAVSVGWRTRWAAAAFCLAFTYIELLDKATYLNHYYLVSLLALLLVVVPSEAAWSFDARRRGLRRATVGAWAYWLLRAQVAFVYVFAGLAKLNADWTFSAQPLRTWLVARADTPIIGTWLAEPLVAHWMSWGGLLFDLSVIPLLLWRRTRSAAVVAALFFHLGISALFPVGVFSLVMLVAISVFFEPSWPERAGVLLRAYRPASDAGPQAAPAPGWSMAAIRPTRLVALLAFLHLLLQLLVPLRFLLYPGQVNWTEEGFRFAWRVMLIEKAGLVEYDVVTAQPERRFRIFPRADLTPLQLKMLSTQPDMIQQYARKLAADFAARGYTDVRVYADAWVSFNGRRARRLVDPHVDLAAAPYSLWPKPWILPLEGDPPAHAARSLF